MSYYRTSTQMNIAASLVESYMYADMFNREYDGGADISERIMVGGAPVNKIAPSLSKKSDRDDGPLANKVVPTGLVIIQIYKEPETEYDDSFYSEDSREVLPDSLHDILFDSILKHNKQMISQQKRHSAKKTPKSSRQTLSKNYKKNNKNT